MAVVMTDFDEGGELVGELFGEGDSSFLAVGGAGVLGGEEVTFEAGGEPPAERAASEEIVIVQAVGGGCEEGISPPVIGMEGGEWGLEGGGAIAAEAFHT